MAPRANWKGHLRLGALSCPIALYSAATQAERVSFTTLNRATGNPVRRVFVEEGSGEPVEREAQVKGYDLGDEAYVVLEQDEIDAAVPKPTKVLEIEACVPVSEMDLVFLDQPYYLAPSGVAGAEVFALLRQALEKEGAGALARTVIFRRERLFFAQPYGAGLLAHSLHYDYEVRSVARGFTEVPEMKIPAEMRELAAHIIDTKRGHYDPAAFDDRYEAALVEVIRAKQAGKPIRRAPPPAAEGKVVDLLEALRRSAGRSGGGGKARAGKSDAGKPASKRRTAAKKTAARKPPAEKRRA